MSEFRLRIDTTSDRALEFVNGLAYDDEFRARLESEPRAVLWDYGVEVSDELIPARIELPEKEELQRLLAGAPKGVLPLHAGPQLFYPVFMCFYSFPFLTGDR